MARTGSIVRIVIGIAVGLFVALGSGGMFADDVSAKPKRVQEQNNFVSNCRETGGTPRRIGHRTVQCTWPSGNSSTCNFETGVCTTVSQMERRAGSGTSSDTVTPVSSEPVDAKSSDDASVDSSLIVPLD